MFMSKKKVKAFIEETVDRCIEKTITKMGYSGTKEYVQAKVRDAVDDMRGKLYDMIMQTAQEEVKKGYQKVLEAKRPSVYYGKLPEDIADKVEFLSNASFYGKSLEWSSPTRDLVKSSAIKDARDRAIPIARNAGTKITTDYILIPNENAVEHSKSIKERGARLLFTMEAVINADFYRRKHG